MRIAILAFTALFFLPQSADAAMGVLDRTGRTLKPFAVTCAATATAIRAAAGETYTAWACQNPSSTAVYIGDSTVTTSNGYPMCAGASCGVTFISLDVNLGYCRVAASTQEIRCIAIVE